MANFLSGPSRTIILLLPPLILLSAYLAVLTLGAMITFNFLLLGLLLLALNGLFDLAVNLIGRLFL